MALTKAGMPGGVSGGKDPDGESSEVSPAVVGKGRCNLHVEIKQSQSEEWLTKLNKCFLSFGVDPDRNINLLTALCGELLGATCALYNRLDGGLLHSVGQWRTPTDYNPVDRPDGHICYDVLNGDAEHAVVIRNLQKTRYASTDPNVIPYKLQTYIGHPVKFGIDCIGSLCVVYRDDFIPTGEEKKLLGVIASAIGVEEKRRRTEEALRKSENRYKDMLKSITDYVYTVHTEDGRSIRTSHGPGCAAVTGYTEEEYDADPDLWYRMIHEDDRDMVMNNISLALSDVVPPTIEHRIIHKDGTIRWIRDTIVLRYDEQGRLVAYDGFIKDISEQKAGEERLRQQYRFMQDIIESFTHPFYVIDADDYTIKLANSAANFGSFSEKSTCYALTHRRKKPCGNKTGHVCPLNAVKKTKKPARVVHEHRSAEGDVRYFAVYGYPMFDENGNVIQMIEYNVEITEEKRTQEMLVQSAKLASIGELAANVAHEINNPMAAVLGYTQLILEEMEEDNPEGSSHYEELKAIERESLRIREIVRNLLDFARERELKREESDINEVLKETLALTIHLSEKSGIVTETDYGEGIPDIMVDKNQLKQVFLNIINNACHAMERGGKLRISTSLFEPSPDEKYIHIRFKDTGCGIEKGALERIFDPFFSTKGERGTGLGLSVSYGIIRNHGGEILVDSREGEGTEFTVRLPVQ